jgi:hypothetical protein
MKLARLNSENKIVELFDSTDVKTKFHPDFVKLLVKVGSTALVGEIFFKGKNYGKAPDDESIFVDGAWIKDPEIIAQRELAEKVAQAKSILEDVSGIKDPEAKKAIRALIFLINRAAV